MFAAEVQLIARFASDGYDVSNVSSTAITQNCWNRCRPPPPQHYMESIKTFKCLITVFLQRRISHLERSGVNRPTGAIEPLSRLCLPSASLVRKTELAGTAGKTRGVITRRDIKHSFSGGESDKVSHGLAYSSWGKLMLSGTRGERTNRLFLTARPVRHLSSLMCVIWFICICKYPVYCLHCCKLINLSGVLPTPFCAVASASIPQR